MLLRIVLIACLVFGLMAAIKSGAILQDAGLLADCKPLTALQGTWGEVRSCNEGKLNGWRDLSDNCQSMGRFGAKEYWRCPPSQQIA